MTTKDKAMYFAVGAVFGEAILLLMGIFAFVGYVGLMSQQLQVCGAQAKSNAVTMTWVRNHLELKK